MICQAHIEYYHIRIIEQSLALRTEASKRNTPRNKADMPKLGETRRNDSELS